ncbi:MAG: transglutaminase domain-containing protein, partial [Thermoleophilia bacterium]|nr:transglutaminase domain-containing protein [Thermoleophilia bacterium]
MIPRRALLFLAFAWVLVALYSDPGLLVRSVRNTVSPQVDPVAVGALAASLPNDPRAVEAYVLDRQVPYAYDWQSAGVPWYFPTTAEALRTSKPGSE